MSNPTSPDSVCACGRDSWRIKSALCRRCYVLRYNTPELLPTREPVGTTPRTAIPCTYAAAHERIKCTRGKAAQYLCQCGKQAEQWSYNHSSPWEITGPNRQGRTVTYSPFVWDYDPLCRVCHSYRDRNRV